MPVFDINMHDVFPMPTLEQGSPFGGVLSNAIAKRLKMAEAQKAEKELPYAGLSKLAQILSQSAYANAVLPQAQMKLLGVPGAVSNLKNPQSTVNSLENLGTGSNDLQSIINQQLLEISRGQNQYNPGVLGQVGQGLKNLFISGNAQQPNVPTNQNTQASVTNLQNAPIMTNTPPTRTTNQNVNPSGRSPESKAWSENQAEHEKIVSKGKALGTETAKQQAEYGPAAKSVLSQERAEKTLTNIFKDPEINKIANVPFSNQKSIAWYKQTGNEAQKRKLGEMESAMNSYVGASLGMFGPRGATDKDITFLQSMKPSDSDLMDVRKGKLSALKAFTEGQKQSIKLAHQYMSQGMDQADAEFKASEEIDMNKIQENAYKDVFEKHNLFNPKDLTAENLQHTAQKRGISVLDLIEKLEKKHKIKIRDYIPNAD